jgi:hypothetical protein
MKTLQIDEKNAKRLYPTATAEFKATLEDTFGKEFFSQKITDRIKTFEDACQETGEDPNDLKFSTGTPDEIAYKKIKVVVKALNQGWVPDYSNSNQRKWYPWFQFSGSGFRFFGAIYGCTFTDSSGGSRLCLPSEELAVHLGKTFISEFNQFLK